MTNATRGPRPGRVPPHIQDRLEDKRRRAERRELLGPWYRRNPFVATVAAVVALIAGVAIGRWTAPDPIAEAVEPAATSLDLAEAGLILWTAGLPTGAPPIEQGLEQLRAGDPAVVREWLDEWLLTYQRVIENLRDQDVPPAAGGVRDLFLASVEVQRDATETLGAAVTVEGEARDLLLLEAERLRARGEEFEAAGRRLLERLQGEEVDAPPSPATGPTLPRPTAEADATEPPASPEPSPEPSPTGS